MQGFPSVKVYVPGTGKKNPYTGKFFKPPVDYGGPRTARGVVDFATGALPSYVLPVTDKSFGKFKSENSTLPKAVLFTKKTETTSSSSRSPSASMAVCSSARRATSPRRLRPTLG